MAEVRPDRFELIDVGPGTDRSRRLPVAPGHLAPHTRHRDFVIAVLATGVLLLTANLVPPAPAAGPDAHDRLVTCGRRQECRARQSLDWAMRVRNATQKAFGPGTVTDGFAMNLNESFWAGGEGSLEVQMASDDRQTTIRVEVGTSPAAVTACGHRTTRRCSSQLFMDGNSYQLSASTWIADGLEVTYGAAIHRSEYVFARGPSTTGITRDQLITLAQDPALALPAP